MTVDGGGILAFINVAAEHLLGLNAAEHVGRPVLDELERRSTALWAAVVAGIRQSRRVSRAEGTAARPDGHAVPIGLSTTILERRTDTRPTVTAIFTDISDLQVVQELQRRAERLEAVASLSASLAHEIRNPLASIRSSGEQRARGGGEGRRRAGAGRPGGAREGPADQAAGRVPRFLPGACRPLPAARPDRGGPRGGPAGARAPRHGVRGGDRGTGRSRGGRSRRGPPPPDRQQPAPQLGAGDERRRPHRGDRGCPGPLRPPAGKRIRSAGAAPDPGQRAGHRSRPVAEAVSAVRLRPDRRDRARARHRAAGRRGPSGAGVLRVCAARGDHVYHSAAREMADGGGRMTPQASILIVDDETGILDTLRILLRKEGFEVSTAQGGKAGLEQIRSGNHDIVLTDVRMPQVSGLDILQVAKEQDGMTPVILMTAQASLQTAIAAVNAGAFYYIQKPFSNDELLAIIRRACEYRQIRVENRQLKQDIRRKDKSTISRPIGKSRRFMDVLRLAEQVAPTDSTVLIQGESGTGKEVLARYLHNLSNRAEGPFLSINCGALPENLLESELFGHVKGSFTGAVRDKQGLFAAARGGTFFLDEVGEMPPSLQIKLLRVLQEREVIPVGATETIPVDVRIVAATNRDLEEEVRRGHFRSDLFYRLNVIAVELPSLRDRRDDLVLLIDHFFQELAADGGNASKALSSDALDAVMVYDWPGNVRELQNALEHAVVLSKGSLIEPAALPERITRRRREPLVAERSSPNPSLDVIERAYIMWVLQAEGGNKTRAAEVLGIDPSTLYRKLSRYEEQPAQG